MSLDPEPELELNQHRQHLLHNHPLNQSTNSSLSSPPTSTSPSPISPSFSTTNYKQSIREHHHQHTFDHYPLLDHLQLHHLPQHPNHHHQPIHPSPVDSNPNSKNQSLDSTSSQDSFHHHHHHHYHPESDQANSSTQSPDQQSPSLKKNPSSFDSLSSSQHPHSSTPDANPRSQANTDPFFSASDSNQPSDQNTSPLIPTNTHPQLITPPSTRRTLPSPMSKTSQRVYPIKSLVKVKNTPNVTPSSSPASLKNNKNNNDNNSDNNNNNNSNNNNNNTNNNTNNNNNNNNNNNRFKSNHSTQPFTFPNTKQSSPISPPPPDRPNELSQSTSSSSTGHRPRSSGSNSSGVSSSTRSRRNDCLPSIAEQSGSSHGSEQSQYFEKMGIGRARRSSATRFFLPTNNDPSSIPMASHPSHSHSRQMASSANNKQAPASMALARLRRKGKDFSGDSVEVLSILSQLNSQFDKAEDMPTFLKMAVGLVRELTGFDRVMIYKFDESWNGQVVAELVDWKRTRDLYRGLRFPASARELYKINKVRMLYDRDQPTARLMCKSQEELSKPLNMTHCHLRAMSPIHIKYLANMGVRSSFSISIIMNDELWGLISCHSYGRFGQRVTFPTRHFCTMLGDTVSRNILRLNLSQRLQSRKLINTTSTSKNPSGYIVAKAEDLLWLFDAQAGVLSIGEEAKILGVVSNSQEILAILEYLRVRKFDTIQVSTDINQTFPDIEYPGGFESISGLLVIPLSRSGQDFICFFRPAQSKEIHWAGNPHEKLFKDDKNSNILEPRKSFKIWSETVKERSKAWTDEQLETGSVLSLVYGKFIDVWRQKEAAVQNNQLQALLLSNASHEVRTPLHQILSTLELALDGQLDEDTRDNLSKSYSASRALVHVINDLLDLTKAEQGGDLFSRDPFNLPSTLQEAVSIHHREAERKGLAFEMVEDPRGAPVILQGDRARLRQVVSNLVGNAVKHTTEGLIHVQWGFEPQETVQPDPQDQNLMSEDIVRISVAVTDTGKGIPEAQLENIFRAFEQVGSGESQDDRMCESIGLGLAVVGRVVHNMGGQLRVDSTVNQGSKFTITLPFVVPKNNNSRGSTARNSDDSSNVRSHGSDSFRSKHSGKMQSSRGSQGSNHGSIGTSSSGIDEIVDAITGESSGRNSSEAPYSPRLASSFQNRKSPRKSISFGSTEGSKGSGSAHSLGSNMGGEMSRRRISSASNQSLSSKSHNIAESHRRLPKGTPASPRMATNDGPSKTKQVTPQEDISRRHSTKPRTTEPSQPLSPSSNKPKKDRNAFASKIERPSIHTITEPGEPSSSTLTPERAKRLQADDTNL
ncbi:uncharacterized protein PGTG_21762 [Puccinia graminis f. sp. tritici CRL 75-36-700-3]|uniref:Light-sensor Protein kinase n=1 Tax=Puccinia graminis f. sp. tritici (strain CRL 75-36-700-3 / race SCCL) TaxID=418459 RepID=H6QSE5_PUCGT|nr:uncharacterized protein PGTG_21762 [Puccinia graminis f. sp. tritici CRL 75-36-700-3]EHS63676.1 hypothetical protein PGTG_21762 [Puccinia graminis f. sp. tritici CRL 75-36-700-3]